MAFLAEVMSGGLYPGAGIDSAFDRATGPIGGMDVWVLIIGYGFQLYFSFCGFCHVVIGAARLFGIQLQENFNRPYLSTTISVFWTRWHMSLSFWIRDFLFLPLATMRREVWWRNLSLVIAMFVFGLWHGGTVLFMTWGVYHGLLLVLHRQWQELRKRMGFEWAGILADGISWVCTFGAVCIGYIFFRSETVAQALAMLRGIVDLRSYPERALPPSLYFVTLAAFVGYFAVLGGGSLLDRLRDALRPHAQAARGKWRELPIFLLGALEEERWIWITPLVVVLTLYLSVIFQPGRAETGPVMYALF
jgi:alginate O-acetyltransferase complex protein AlgI